MLLRALALLLIALGGFIIVSNWLTPALTRRTGRNHSAVPLLGAVFTGAGLWLLPAARHWAWAPFLADCGTLFLLAGLPIMVYQEWRTSRFNFIAEYWGQRDALTVRVRLFQQGHCVVVEETRRAPGEAGIVGLSLVGTWRRHDDHLTLQAGGKEASYAIVAQDNTETLRPVNGFASRDGGPQRTTQDVELVRRTSGRNPH